MKPSPHRTTWKEPRIMQKKRSTIVWIVIGAVVLIAAIAFFSLGG
ncbi:MULTISPECIES: hypothetical protein [unclassified Microbacterium]|nr:MULTISPECIES: hypothetical protein [unclassified Microbacterium]